jgi:hypothetical protein
VTDITARPDQLHGTSGQYQTLADQVAQVYRVLTALLEAEGACWGNDESGFAFGTKYVPAALSTLSQMDDTHQGIQSMIDGICSWAKNYVDATGAAKSGAHQITTPPVNSAGLGYTSG